MSRCFARSAPLLRTKQRIFGMVLAFLILNVTRDAEGMNVTIKRGMGEELVKPDEARWYLVSSAMWCIVKEQQSIHFWQFCVHLRSFFFPYEMLIHASVVVNDAGYTTNCNLLLFHLRGNVTEMYRHARPRNSLGCYCCIKQGNFVFSWK